MTRPTPEQLAAAKDLNAWRQDHAISDAMAAGMLANFAAELMVNVLTKQRFLNIVSTFWDDHVKTQTRRTTH
ncbi:MAG TPA: hypothetical protein VGK73_04035 [Polyangiaceae bacterium]